MSLGITEIILILVVVLLIFGADKIPELARGVGKAEAEYKKAKAVFKNELSTSQIKAKKSVSKKSVKETSTTRKTKSTAKTKSTRKVASKKTSAKKTQTKKRLKK